jgi:hypothetical protein
MQSDSRFTPSFEVLGELVQVGLLNCRQISHGVEAILVESGLSVSVQSNARKRSTESNSVSDSSHGEGAKICG